MNKKDIIKYVKRCDDCKYLVFGVSEEGALEYFKCYTYQQCDELVGDMKYESYKDIDVVKLK